MASSGLLEATITIVGVRPFIWHHFTIDALAAPGEKKQKGGTVGYDPDEWRSTVLAADDGRLYMLPTYLFACLVSGGRFTTKGRGSLMTAVGSSLQIIDNIILFNRELPDNPTTPDEDPHAEVYLDRRSVVNPGTDRRNVRTRVATNSGWECSFTIQWDGSQVSPSQMKKVVEDAGALVGVGDGRKIGFGRFEVKSFEMLNGS